MINALGEADAAGRAVLAALDAEDWDTVAA
jgi:hypothetical protein